MAADEALRKQLIDMLKGAHAHVSFDETVKDFPRDKVGVRPPGLPHSAWELLEHIRIAQHDIVRFSEAPDHVSPKWPDGYWPSAPAPAPSRRSSAPRWRAGRRAR